MSKSRETWNKKKWKPSARRSVRRKRSGNQKKADSKSSGKRSFEEMIAYVDENGQLTTMAPDKTKRKKRLTLIQFKSA